MIIEQFTTVPAPLAALIQQDDTVFLVACSEVFNLEGTVRDCFLKHDWELTEEERAREALEAGEPAIYCPTVHVYAVGHRISNP